MRSGKKKSSVLKVYRYDDDGQMYSKSITIGPCPHCGNLELIATEIEYKNEFYKDYAQHVECGDCGAGGPWGRSQQEAVEIWNATTKTENISITEWKKVDLTPVYIDGVEIPF